MKLTDAFPIKPHFPECWSATQFMAGVECEIEGCKDVAPNYANFATTTDASLRSKRGPDGKGWEFISVPLTREHLVASFANLHAQLKFHKDEEPFSPRTSTHVHVNCIPLSLEDIKNILLLYVLFEEFFFAMVKPDRRSNIHCVPLTETTMPGAYGMKTEMLIKHWHKYTALNLLRLKDIGTIEFRHLHGTGDKEEFNQWLQVLENLWTLGQRVQVNRTNIQNKEEIIRWFDFIFAPSQKIGFLRPTLFNVIRNNLIDVKFSLVKD